MHGELMHASRVDGEKNADVLVYDGINLIFKKSGSK